MAATCIATALEERRPLPVDAIIPDPIFTSTHAITIDSSPEQVWPWISLLAAPTYSGTMVVIVNARPEHL